MCKIWLNHAVAFGKFSNFFVVKKQTCQLSKLQLIVLILKMTNYSLMFQSDLNIVASFNRRGDYIFTGNGKGRILVLETDNFAVKASFKISPGTASNTAVKSIEFARRGSFFLVNTADRIIRIYDSTEILACGKDGEPEPTQKLQDLVNKTTWKKCCFSGDGEYVCAGSARQHALYIWEKSIGNIVKILSGTKGEMLLDVVVSYYRAFNSNFFQISMNQKFKAYKKPVF